MTRLDAQSHPSRPAAGCRRRLISLGVLAMLATAQAQAQAQAREAAPAASEQPVTQDPAAAPENIVVVTGFRASLNSALTTKKNSDGIVDVIKAEDIAKFPDANPAESLQHVPGVAPARPEYVDLAHRRPSRIPRSRSRSATPTSIRSAPAPMRCRPSGITRRAP